MHGFPCAPCEVNATLGKVPVLRSDAGPSFRSKMSYVVACMEDVRTRTNLAALECFRVQRVALRPVAIWFYTT